MRIESSKPSISEYNFFRLLISTLIIRKDVVIIKKYELEEDLYQLYNNPDFHFLFEDVCKKEGVDNSYVDLNVAFETAYAFGLLVLIQDAGDIRSIVNLSDEQAIQIQSAFKPNEVDAMNRLCEELKKIKDKSKQLVLERSKNSVVKQV